MGLTKKQRDFVNAYLECWNQSEAARRAGYANPYNNAHRLMENDGIRKELEIAIAESKTRPDEILVRLAARTRATIADVLRLPPLTTPGSTAPKGIDGWSLDLVKAQQTGGIHNIKKIKETKYGVEIEMYDRLPALELAGKHHGLFKDDGGILKYIDLTKLSPEQLQRLADGDDPLAVILNTATDSGAGAD